MEFTDRSDAGRELAERLTALRGEDVVVLGLPRGGVPVAFEVARALRAPLDAIVVRKLGVPHQPELAMGAIGEGGVRVVNGEIVRRAGVSAGELAAVERAERAELRRRVEAFRAGRSRIDLAGRTALIVDDGVATGATARAACRVARELGAARVVLAVPVGAPGAIAALRHDADEVVCMAAPAGFTAVGRWYHRFGQVSDGEVAGLLGRPVERSPRAEPAADPPLRDEDVDVPVGALRLAGHLTVPEHPAGVVVFAHGSGSSRHSPRNRYMAGVLNECGLGTLLLDLLTSREEVHRDRVFDVGLLAGRLVEVTRWLRDQAGTAGLPVGYFGASTGAAAALCASADPGAGVRAVVSRGGRPDLAGHCLAEVTAPTLLVVGGLDKVVLDLNRRALAALRGESELVVVPGAGHLFEEEPGALRRVARLAADWFTRHLVPSTAKPAT
ncbi:phosphoribosyltransferase family protein [Amycolatopsis thermoflava]|uniref:phosphoribosyltransferase family protein n=1 Tax=Amycolatopsis thermoflava TaxID=84480 RepID=UPI003809375A